jgi:adenylate cyclase
MLEPAPLRALLNRYYEVVFEPVHNHGGFVSDVVGDAVLALWTATSPDPALAEKACRAALDVVAGVDGFNRRRPEAELPTRLGLHCGTMFLGDVGAGDHYEYRAVGDIVNASTRIEGLNTQLGTRVLASGDVVAGLEAIACREVGKFRLVGKSQALIIHEVIGLAEELSEEIVRRNCQFAQGLSAFRRQRWEEAIGAFRRVLTRHGRDGPSQYYLKLCERHLNEPRLPNWDGIINLRRK